MHRADLIGMAASDKPEDGPSAYVDTRVMSTASCASSTSIAFTLVARARLGLGARFRLGDEATRQGARSPSWRRFLGPMPSCGWISARGCARPSSTAHAGVGDEDGGRRKENSSSSDLPKVCSLRALTTRRWRRTTGRLLPTPRLEPDDAAWPRRRSPCTGQPAGRGRHQRALREALTRSTLAQAPVHDSPASS